LLRLADSDIDDELLRGVLHLFDGVLGGFAGGGLGNVDRIAGDVFDRGECAFADGGYAWRNKTLAASFADDSGADNATDDRADKRANDGAFAR